MFPGGPLASYSNQHLSQLKSFSRLKSVDSRNTRSLVVLQIYLRANGTLLWKKREHVMGGRGEKVGCICEVKTQNEKIWGESVSIHFP